MCAYACCHGRRKEGRKDIGLAIAQDTPNNNNKGLVSATPSSKPQLIIIRKKNQNLPVLQTTEMVCFPPRKEATYFLRNGVQKRW